MTFTPSALLAYSTVYTATLSTEIEDLAGNQLASPHTWSFTVIANQAPTASVGAEQEVSKGGAVTLDARASTDPENDALGYAWTQLAGPSVGALTGAQPAFVAPDSVTTLAFQLVVLDSYGNQSAPVQTAVYVLGHPGKSVWVATTGTDANAGTRAAPKRTITAAIAAVAANAPGDVYVARGTYAEAVSLADGISVYGGYDAGWRRPYPADSTVIQTGTLSNGNVVAVYGQSTSGITLDRLSVHALGTLSNGASTYGIYLRNATGVALHGVVVQAGDAGSGQAGTAGSAGADGGGGSGGQPGTCDAGNGVGGAGGVPAGTIPGTPGGRGGNGGPEGAFSGQAGTQGGGGGGLGGVGGGGGDPGGTGAPGSPGSAGSVGSNGAGGSGYSLVNGLFLSAPGETGADGTPGLGGGGGGGGGGQGCTFCDNGGGNGAGGGGAGGAAGLGGPGGMGGGGSFGLFLVNATVTLAGSKVTSGNGGAGGNGGGGGSGGAGGRGGSGAAACTAEIGAGGSGGAGGAGGAGGPGGGGAGGASFAIFQSGSILTSSANVLAHGTGGAGGTGPGTAGTAGPAADTNP